MAAVMARVVLANPQIRSYECGCQINPNVDQFSYRLVVLCIRISVINGMQMQAVVGLNTVLEIGSVLSGRDWVEPQ